MNSSVRSHLNGLGFSEQRLERAELATRATAEIREEIRSAAGVRQWRVLEALQAEGLSELHLLGTTGYGYGDSGRELLDRAMARIFHAPSALVRIQLVSGTHAITAGLFGALRPGDELMSLTGAPYDTLLPTIGPGPGSLAELQVSYRQLDLLPGGCIDLDGVAGVLNERTRMVFIQRSRGYTWRPSISVAQIGEAIARLRVLKPEVVIMVDNCYGELVEDLEPTQVGADLVAGSLIKNLGGALAPTGGYLAGGEEWIARAAARFSAPGIGGEQGPTLGLYRPLIQGLFQAPTIIGHALEGAVWAAHLLEQEGYEVEPRWNDPRTDLIQAIQLGSPEGQMAFCRGIQLAGPVDHKAVPTPCVQPGYRNPILMAGGTFVAGSTLELSADGPQRPPYACYLQGGISLAHVQIGVLRALSELDKLHPSQKGPHEV
jgi:cystathionine beta-lyase family protein involved in aluminum resistance